MLKLRERLLLAALFFIFAAYRVFSDFDAALLIPAGARPSWMDAATPRTWSNFSLDVSSQPPGEWPYPPKLLEAPPPPKCTLVTHLCRGIARQSHSDQVISLVRYLWTARRIMNCAVVKPYFCSAPEYMRGAIGPGEYYEVDWQALGGHEKTWTPLPTGHPLPEYNATLTDPYNVREPYMAPCLIDWSTAFRVKNPQQAFPVAPFQCESTVIMHPPSIDETTLRGIWGIPYPQRLPTWLGGSTFSEMAEAVSMIVKPARWIVGLTERILSAVLLGDEKINSWHLRQFPSEPITNFTKSKQRKFVEQNLPPYIAAHVRLNDFRAACPSDVVVEQGKTPFCGADFSSLGVFLAKKLHDYFIRVDRESFKTSRGDETNADSPKHERVIVIATDAERPAMKQLSTRIIEAYQSLAGNDSAPPVVLFPSLLRQTPQIENLIQGGTNHFPKDPTARKQRVEVMRTMIDQLILGCASRLYMSRQSTFSARAQEMGLHICRQRGKKLMLDGGVGWVPGMGDLG